MALIQRKRTCPESMAREGFGLTVEMALIQRQRGCPESMAREGFGLTVEMALIQRRRRYPESMAREGFDLTVEMALIQRQRRCFHARHNLMFTVRFKIFCRKCVLGKTLKLLSGSCYLPRPDKEETGGEDAHFICANEQAVGVADGVGGWAEVGIDAGQYSRELMSNSIMAVQEEPQGSVDPFRVLEKAYFSRKAKGSSTACIISLTDQGLHAINLGDSGFMVVRDGCTVFRSPVQQHGFNITYQLESGNSGNLPRSGQVFTIPVAPGDVVIAGTDGFLDDLYNNEITAVVVHATRTGLGPQVNAQKIAAFARQRAKDKDRQTTFSTSSQDVGIRYYGGKLDDITVVVSYITSSNDEKQSAA